MKKTLLLLTLTAFLLVPLGAAATAEAGGQVDAGFGKGGKVVHAFGAEEGLEAALLSDGRVIAAGRGKAMALLPSGEIDSSFGDAGFLSMALPPGGEGAGIATVLVDTQGRLLVVGNCTFPTEADYLPFYSLAIVARYSADGRLDTSFGDEGFALIDPGLRSESRSAQPQISITDAALDNAGRVVFAGTNSGSRRYKGSFIGTSEPFVARLTAEGEVDRSFSGDGVLPVFGTERINTVALDSRGGVYLSAFKEQRSVLIHLGADGAIDRGFGENGFRMQPYDAIDGPVLQAASGRLLIFRYLSSWPAHRLAGGVQIKRLLPDGSLDRSFGQGGEARFRLPRFDRYTLEVDDEGRILIGANLKRRDREGRRPALPGALALIRLQADGSVDPGFGRNGVIKVPYGHRWEVQPQRLDVVGDEALLGAYWYSGDERHAGRTFVRIHLGP